MVDHVNECLGTDITPQATSEAAWLTNVAGTDNVTATPPPGFAGLVDGMCFAFEAIGANAGPMTLDVGTGAKPMVLPGGAAMVGGEVSAAGYVAECFYIADHDHYHTQLIRQPYTTAAAKLSGAASAGTDQKYARGNHQHGSAIVGVADNSSAIAGDVGETISSTLLTGAGVAATSGVAANITSISLTAGDWDVTGNVIAQNTVTAGTRVKGMSSATSATFESEEYAMMNHPASVEGAVAIPPRRFSLNATTTIYLVGETIFGAGVSKLAGTIRARRRR